ncbi:MAG: CopD family protein [Acidobacteria bacterium]|jgi:uncharacterized membrane protein|nr:CopD family protein [Acidobacteriota bacterium]MCU0254765.1 CopD family protein [Acidobacteriota bacterium]
MEGLLKVVHLFGIVMWIGALLIASLQLRQATKLPREAQRPVLDAMRRLHVGFGLPGMILTIAAGLILLMLHTEYFTQGWMHAKLTFVFLLIVLDLCLFALQSKLREVAGSPGPPLLIHVVAGLAFLGTLAAVFLMRTVH